MTSLRSIPRSPLMHAVFFLVIGIGFVSCRTTGTEGQSTEATPLSWSQTAPSTAGQEGGSASTPGLPSHESGSCECCTPAFPDEPGRWPTGSPFAAKAPASPEATDHPFTVPSSANSMAAMGYGDGEAERWTAFLPLLGDVAKEKGFDLPLPIGFGVNFLHIKRATEVKSVRAGINGGPRHGIEFLSFDPSAEVTSLVGRLDAWVLPMVNIYAMAGYIWNHSEVDMYVDVGDGPGAPIKSKGRLEGPVYGGGITVAGGYKDMFLSLDANMSRADLEGLSSFDAMLASGRVGWNTKLGDMDFRLWTGTTYWDTERTIKGKVKLDRPVIKTIEFEVHQKPEDPFTILLGSSLTVNKVLFLLLELQGWDKTVAITAGATYRF